MMHNRLPNRPSERFLGSDAAFSLHPYPRTSTQDLFAEPMTPPGCILGFRREATTSHRRRPEKLLDSLARKLVDTPTHQLENCLRTAIQSLVEGLGMERGGVAEFNAADQLTPTYAYAASAFPPLPAILLDERHARYRAELRQGKYLLLACLPTEVHAALSVPVESTSLPCDIAHLLLPLCVVGTVAGVLVLGSFHPSHALMTRISALAHRFSEVLGQALARLQAERQMQFLRDQMARISRVSLLGELAGTIAHEVNQPLCAIVSNAQAAQRFLSADPIDLTEIREALVDIAADSQRASDILARIRGLLQNGKPACSPLDVNQAIREAASMVNKVLLRHQVTLALHLADDLPVVTGDRIQLQQVLLNLLINAIDALGQEERRDRRVEVISSRSAQGTIEVVVRDNGPGLLPENLDRAFDPFFTTKAHGMGIGLSICRSLLEAIGGRIWAAPSSNGGAAFHFTLPRQDPR